MTRSLSILLPTYCCRCVELVKALHAQCEAVEGLLYEIVVADDGTPEKAYIAENREIERLPNVRYIVREENVGRSRIRNFLVGEARYEWVLFIDGDLALDNSLYIRNYLQTEGDLIVGGIEIIADGNDEDGTPLCGNLRWKAEQAHVGKNSAAYRREHALELHTNFLVRRRDLTAHPFDESFSRYGYEDVMLGKTLVRAGLRVVHIDNPVTFAHYESNARFLHKTEEALTTLHENRERLRDVNHLLPLAQRLERWRITPLLHLSYKILKHALRKNLLGNNPSIFVFNMYKLGYYIHLSQSKND